MSPAPRSGTSPRTPTVSKKAAIASVIVTALRSGEPVKIEAILERLDLPKSERVDPAVMQALTAGLANSEPSALDPLYDAFLSAGGGTEKKSEAPALPQAQAELVKELVLRTTPESSPGDRFRAALILANASHAEGFEALLRDLPELTTAQKTAIVEHLYEPSISAALPVLEQLIRDPIPEVRSAAASSALSNDDAPAFAGLVFQELARPGTPLKAHEIYSYRFESIVRSQSLAAFVRNWCVSVLTSKDADTSLKVLATIGLRNTPAASAIRTLKELTTSPDPILRRAAWHALLTLRPNEIRNASETLLADNEAFVRVVFPLSLSAADSKWSHHFSSLQIIPDSRWSGNSQKPRLNETLRKQLETLATQDPSKLVRFEASFTLLTHGAKIDIDEFAALIPQLPKETNARERITEWLSENAARATPGLRPLLAIIDAAQIKPKVMKQLNERINPTRAEGFATFSALAETSNAPPDADTGSLLTAEEKPAAPAERESLEVVYFYKPGCAECAHVKQFLDAIQPDFPQLKLREHNMMQADGTC